MTYSVGTISVAAGGTAVTGAGTSWQAYGIRKGDRFYCAGLVGIIEAVNSNTSITLRRSWAGSAQAGANYDIELVDDNSRAMTASNELILALRGTGTLTSLGALAGAANKFPYWTGAGVMAEADITAAARGLLGTSRLGPSGSDNVTTPTNTRLIGGAVMANQTDTTTGRLVRTTDFGLGISIVLLAEDNLDDIVKSGFYYNSTGANATVANNYPTTTAGSLIVNGRDPSRATQIYITYGTSALASGSRMFTRSAGSSGWTAWSEIYHQGSILGTVSRSGGLPTGALLQRGSNANGEFVKFADGTMICTGLGPALSVETLANGLYVSELTNWTFPSAFSSAPSVVGIASDATRWIGMSGANVNATSYRQMRGAASAGTTQARLLAVGQW